MTDAVLGANLKDRTPHKTATIHVPPGTQPGTVLRLKGKGLPEFGTKRKGDLLIRVGVRIPERLGEEETRHYERLRELGRRS